MAETKGRIMPGTFADVCQTLHAKVPSPSPRGPQFGAMLDAPDHKLEGIVRIVRGLGGFADTLGPHLPAVGTRSLR